LGHIYRCLAITERLKDEFECYVAIREPDEAITQLVRPNAKIIVLPRNENYIDEARQLLTIATQISCEIVLLDGYHFDTQYQQAMMSGNAKLICIDDYAPFHYVADAVINHADGVSPVNISAKPYTKKYLGFEYALLRKQFIDLYNHPKDVNGLLHAFICFGGADPLNITQKVCSAVVNSKSFDSINVIVGSSYGHMEQVKAYASRYDNVKLYHNLNSDDLINVMQSSDAAFVPSSTIAMESYAAHLVLFTGTTAENQKYIYWGLTAKQHVYDLGDFNTTCEENIINKIREVKNRFTPYTIKGEMKTDRFKEVFTSLI
jgi:spore coat polysaccharide biosynthesis predicted glycosyltransferase SpsG